LLAEQAVMNLRTLKTACRAAPHGKVLAVGERLAVQQGRELIRRTLETAMQAEAADLEKKGDRAVPAHADLRGGTADVSPASS
jgi:hypothetical protein